MPTCPICARTQAPYSPQTATSECAVAEYQQRLGTDLGGDWSGAVYDYLKAECLRVAHQARHRELFGQGVRLPWSWVPDDKGATWRVRFLSPQGLVFSRTLAPYENGWALYSGGGIPWPLGTEDLKLAKERAEIIMQGQGSVPAPLETP